MKNLTKYHNYLYTFNYRLHFHNSFENILQNFWIHKIKLYIKCFIIITRWSFMYYTMPVKIKKKNEIKTRNTYLCMIIKRWSIVTVVIDSSPRLLRFVTARSKKKKRKKNIENRHKMLSCRRLLAKWSSSSYQPLSLKLNYYVFWLTYYRQRYDWLN